MKGWYQAQQDSILCLFIFSGTAPAWNNTQAKEAPLPLVLALVPFKKFPIECITVFVFEVFGYFLKHKTQCPQIYIKLTPFEKYYLLRCCSF